MYVILCIMACLQIGNIHTPSQNVTFRSYVNMIVKKYSSLFIFQVQISHTLLKLLCQRNLTVPQKIMKVQMSVKPFIAMQYKKRSN